MSKVDISIILVSFNTRAVTLNCLESIFLHTKDLRFEVIVVDNASSDGSVAALRRYRLKHPIRILSLKHNLGFGGGNNRGAQIAKGKYLLFLNTDTILTGNSLKIALGEAGKEKRLGAYSCQLLNADGSIQATGGYFPTLFRILAWQYFMDDIPLLGKLFQPVHPRPSYYQKRRELDWITGAFLMTPKTVFNSVGGFDENIFMYVEDTDLCFRFKKNGLKIIFSPSASLIHLGGASGGNSLFNEARQTVFFVNKHYGSLQAVFAREVIRLGALLRWGLFGIIGGNDTKGVAYKKIFLGIGS